MWVLSAQCSAVCLGGVLPWPFNAAEMLFYHFVVDPTRKYPEFVLVSSARKSHGRIKSVHLQARRTV